MGQQILYCWKCNVRILGSELESGKASQLGNRASCAACLPQLIENLRPEERSKPPSYRTPPSTPRVRPSSSVNIRTVPEKKASKLGVAAAAGGGALLMTLLALGLSSGPSAPTMPPPPAPARKAVEIPPRELAAREAIAKARAAGTVEAWQEAVFACDGTSKLDDAKLELAKAVAARDGGLEREFLALAEEARALLRDEEYGKAIATLEAAKARRGESDWRLRIENRIAEIRALPAEKLPPLLERAADLKRREAGTELREIEARVARWGMAEHVDTLRAALAKVPAGKPYQQGSDGFLVIEAERFHVNVPVGEHAWVEAKSPPGYAGAGAMRGLPQKASKFEKNYASAAARLEFLVTFTKTGRHYAWARGHAAIADDNSIHLGFEERTVKTLEGLTVPAGKDWAWTNTLWPSGTAYVDIDKPGSRVLRMYIREDGIAIDRVVFTPDPKWKPEGSGPPESPR